MAKPFKLTPPRPFIPLEYDEQVRVFEYLKFCKLAGANLVFATMNGIRVTPGLAKKMKKAGNKAGVPDIVVPVARNGFHSLYVELKREKGGVVSEAQDVCHAELRAEGNCVIVANGAQQAIEAIVEYLR